MSDQATTLPGPVSEPDGSSDTARRAGVGLALAIRRARAGRYTLAELAQRAGLSVGLLSLIERGRGNPSLTTLARIAEALDLGLVELVAAAVEASGTPSPEPRDNDGGLAAPPAPAEAAAVGPAPGDALGGDVIAPGPGGSAGRRPVGRQEGSTGWVSSMTLRGGQEATVAVGEGALELSLRDRTDELAEHDAPQPLSVTVSVRSVGGEPVPKLPDVDDPRWLDVVRGATSFRPASLAGQLLFTHVVRCTRVDPSASTLEHWIGELRGYLLAEPLPPAELAAMFGE